jgi:hypothetical protein
MRKWADTKTIGLVCTILSLALILNSCGGGVSGNQPPKPLWETTRAVGPEGATIEPPEQYGAKVEIAQGTFADSADITVQVFSPDAFRPPAGSSPVSHYIRLVSSADVQDNGRITVELPAASPRSPDEPQMRCALIQLPDSKWWITEVDLEGTSNRLSVHIDKRLIELLRREEATRVRSRVPLWVIGIVVVVVDILKQPKPSVTFYKWQGDSWSEPVDEPLPVDWRGKKIALVLHGMLSKIKYGKDQPIGIKDLEQDVSDMAKNIARSGVYDEIWGIEYNWTAKIADNGNLLAEKLARVRNIAQVDLLDIHAHSMGGLVARWAIEETNDKAMIPVFRLFTYGTPHQGVPKTVAMNFLRVASERLIDTDGVRDLFEGSQLLQTLNAGGSSSSYYIFFAGLVLNEEEAGDLYKWLYALSYRSGELTDGVVSVRSADPLSSPDRNGANIIGANCRFYTSGTNGQPLRGFNHSKIKSPPDLRTFIQSIIK